MYMMYFIRKNFVEKILLMLARFYQTLPEQRQTPMVPTISTTNTVEVRFHVKLLIDTKSRTVLCAEANSDFVDFLFTLFSLPLGTKTKLISSINDPNGMVGFVGNLYKSIENLSDDYLKQPIRPFLTGTFC